MSDLGTTWPEQDAVDAWLDKHQIDAPHFVSMELKNAVTKPRRACQDKLTALEAENKRLRKAAIIISDKLQWWAEDGSRPDEWLLKEWARELKQALAQETN